MSKKRRLGARVIGKLIDSGNGMVELEYDDGSLVPHGIDRDAVRFNYYPKYVKKPVCPRYNDYLRTVFHSKPVFHLLDKLAEYAAPKTCKLPIRPGMSYQSMAESLGESDVRRFKSAFKYLEEVGAVAYFDMHEEFSDYKMYWLLNPALFFNGMYIKVDVLHLFSDTEPMIKLMEYSNNKIKIK